MNISRQSALASGERRYFTGMPCKHGHISERLVSTRACCKCAALAVSAYNKANGKKIAALVKTWRIENPVKYAAHQQASIASPSKRIAKRMSVAMRKAMNGAKAGRSWERIVGYTVGELRSHLEKQFTPRMSWANADEWHIDHIVAKSTFDHSIESELKACWALANLRPLMALENMQKHSKSTHLI